MSLPERLGRLRRVDRIGAGGFATVWLYHDDELDSPVAVKALADNWAQRSDVCERFIEEARILRRADSDHVVRVYDIGQVDSTPYFVMSYADRGTVADLLTPGVPLPVERAVDLVSQAAAGVEVLHRHGVIHRDIKPQNLLLTSTPDGREQVLVADLGVAKAMLHASGLTQVVGTPAYMAPEQATGEGLDLRADVHALGAVAYQMLTGRLVREGGIGSLSQPLIPIAPSRVADLPPSLDAVLLRALALDPDDRWPDVPSFVTALRAAAEAGGADIVPIDTPRRGRRLRTALLTVVVLAVAFGGAFAATRFIDRDGAAAAETPSSGSSSPDPSDGSEGSGGSDAPSDGASPQTDAPAPDIDYPPLVITDALTYDDHTLVDGDRTWRYPVPTGWVPYGVTGDAGDAGRLTPEEVDQQVQVRWRPDGEPLEGGFSLRVRLLPADGSGPLAGTVGEVVDQKAQALRDSPDLQDVDVFRTTTDGVYFSYRDGNDRERYNYFMWIGDADGNATLEISVSGRRIERANLDKLLQAVGAGAARVTRGGATP